MAATANHRLGVMCGERTANPRQAPSRRARVRAAHGSPPPSSPPGSPLGTALVAVGARARLAVSACQRETSCTVEVTEAKGVFRGTIAGARSQVDLEREALRAACGQVCGAQGATQASGCVSRCALDVEAGKITKRSTCTEASSR